MFYLKKDEENNSAVAYVKQCLDAHIEMKRQKEIDFLDLYKKYQNGNGTLDEALEVEEEIKITEHYINAINYTLDYVKLMIKVKKNY